MAKVKTEKRSSVDSQLVQSNLTLQEMRAFIAWFDDKETFSACPKLLAERTLMSERNCYRALRSLERKKVIKRDGFIYSQKNQKIVRYKFTGYLPERVPRKTTQDAKKTGLNKGQKDQSP